MNMVNIAEKNLKRFKELESEGVDFEHITPSNLSGIFKCVKCCGHVTLPNIRFFNWDVSKVLCYTCQKKKDSETNMDIDFENRGVLSLNDSITEH